MNDVKVFEKSELGSVRVVGTKEQPLFCLRDVCDVLGIAQTKDIKASIIKEFDKDGDLIPYPIKTAGGTHISLKTLVYQKGLNYIRRVVEQEQSKGEI